MSIYTTRSNPHKTRTRSRRNNPTYYSHECPICHCDYTTQRRESRHCGKPGCRRIFNLEEARRATPTFY